MKKILITGATGFIGKRLVRSLQDEDVLLYLLVRKDKFRKTQELYTDNEKIKIIKGDILESEVILNVNDLELVSSEVDSLVHIAAYYDITGSAINAYTTNVIGTQNILYLANQMKKLKHFHYLSTYAVNGHRKGLISEEDLSQEGPFHDEYAKSKMSAELLVRKRALRGVKKRIYRPGIVVVVKDGQPEKIDGPYYFLKMLNKVKDYKPYINILKRIPLPYSKDSQIPLLPVEDLTECLTEGILNPVGEEMVKTYHLLSEGNLTLEDFFEAALEHYNLKIKFFPLRENILLKSIIKKTEFPIEILPHMYSEARYKTDNFRADFTEIANLDIKGLLPQFFATADRFLSEERQG